MKWKKKTDAEKEVDIAAIARHHALLELRGAIESLTVVEKNTGLSKADRDLAGFAKGLAEDALGVLRKTEFKDSEQVKWIKKGARA